MIVIGIDPGKSVGVAALYVDEKTNHVLRSLVYQGDADRALELMEDLISASPGTIVEIACESYHLLPGGGRKTAQPDALSFIGRMKQHFGNRHDVTIKMQAPSDARRLLTNEMMRKLQLWVLPSEVNQRDADDANSAMRHALLLLARHYLPVFDKLVRYAGVI